MLGVIKIYIFSVKIIEFESDKIYLYHCNDKKRFDVNFIFTLTVDYYAKVVRNILFTKLNYINII